jgi:hypothetical protein
VDECRTPARRAADRRGAVRRLATDRPFRPPQQQPAARLFTRQRFLTEWAFDTFSEDASMKLSFLDVHLSQVVLGVAATASEGVLVYHVFVSADALLELGATDDARTWLPAFHRNESLIAARVKAMQRPAPDAPAVIESIAAG